MNKIRVNATVKITNESSLKEDRRRKGNNRQEEVEEETDAKNRAS